MPRTLSPAALRSAFAQQTNEAWIQLITISVVDRVTLEESIIINLAQHPTDIESNGITYKASTWEIVLPPSDPERIPTAQLKFSRVSRDLIEELRGLVKELKIVHTIVLSSTPDTIEVGPIRYRLQDVRYDSQSVSGTLGFETTIFQQYPKDSFVPSKFPGLFS